MSPLKTVLSLHGKFNLMVLLSLAWFLEFTYAGVSSSGAYFLGNEIIQRYLMPFSYRTGHHLFWSTDMTIHM